MRSKSHWVVGQPQATDFSVQCAVKLEQRRGRLARHSHNDFGLLPMLTRIETDFERWATHRSADRA
jgi:hypothetical protein